MHGWGRKESLTEGDSHYWGLWWGLEDWETFENKTGRFISEYGMQSMPDMNTIKSFTDPADRFSYSTVVTLYPDNNRGAINIHPNPVVNDLTVDVNAAVTAMIVPAAKSNVRERSAPSSSMTESPIIDGEVPLTSAVCRPRLTAIAASRYSWLVITPSTTSRKTAKAACITMIVASVLKNGSYRYL